MHGMEILRNLARRRLRTTLTVSGIVIGIFAFTVMGGVAEHVNAILAGGVTYEGSSINVRAAGDGRSLLTLQQVAALRAVPGVEMVTPSITVAAGGPSRFASPDDIIQSADPGVNRYSAFHLSLVAGREVMPDEHGVVALGTQVAQDLNAHLGDTVYLPIRPKQPAPSFTNHPFTVVGLYSRTRTEPDAFAWVGLSDAQRALQATFPVAIRDKIDASTLVQSATVYGPKGAAITRLDKLADRINKTFPAMHADRPSDIVSQFKTGGEIFSLIAVGAALLALVIGGLSVVNTMLMAITERTREIGLKRAVGARTRHIVREVVTESAVIGLIGGLAGYSLGLIAATVLNSTLASAAGGEIFYITPLLTGISIGLAVALGAFAGLIPSWRAARLDPVTALRSQ